jgi:DNA polymerase-1
MASQNPGLQNIPIRTEESRAIRQAFVASPGYTLVSIDYSQIELRVAAILSEDEKLVDIFRRGEDVHTGVAMRVFGVRAEEVTKEMRRKAKVINFGILYGMGVNALRGNLGEDTSREEAQQFYTAYFNTFTRLAEYLEDTKAFARTHGYTETLYHRRRHFPGINSGAPFIRAMAERMAINAPVQGTAADMMRVAMNRIYTRLEKEQKQDDVRMLLQVHDELVFEIKDALVSTEIEPLRRDMEQVLGPSESHGVPIVAEVAVGKNWGELERLST